MKKQTYSQILPRKKGKNKYILYTFVYEYAYIYMNEEMQLLHNCIAPQMDVFKCNQSYLCSVLYIIASIFILYRLILNSDISLITHTLVLHECIVPSLPLDFIY